MAGGLQHPAWPKTPYALSWLPQEELGYLKSLWDMVAAVMFTFTDWYATLWDKIDVDFLVEETKKLTKDIKQLNKAVRNYEVYRCVLQQLKAVACHCTQAAAEQEGQPS